MEKVIFKVRVLSPRHAALENVLSPFPMPAAGATPPFSEPFFSKSDLSISIQINKKTLSFVFSCFFLFLLSSFFPSLSPPSEVLTVQFFPASRRNGSMSPHPPIATGKSKEKEKTFIEESIEAKNKLGNSNH
jgi:hypothetical protein